MQILKVEDLLYSLLLVEKYYGLINYFIVANIFTVLILNIPFIYHVIKVINLYNIHYKNFVKYVLNIL